MKWDEFISTAGGKLMVFMLILGVIVVTILFVAIFSF